MKVYMVNEGYSGGANVLYRAHKKAFSNREKAVDEIRRLIEEDKYQIGRHGDPQFREKWDEKDDCFWLYWKNGSHCWEVIQIEVQ